MPKSSSVSSELNYNNEVDDDNDNNNDDNMNDNANMNDANFDDDDDDGEEEEEEVGRWEISVQHRRSSFLSKKSNEDWEVGKNWFGNPSIDGNNFL